MSYQPSYPQPVKRSPKVWPWLVGAVVLICCGGPMVAGVVSMFDRPPRQVSSSPAPYVAPASDAGARVACHEFRKVMDQVGEGVLTPAEVRDQLRAVHRAAKTSDVVGVAAGGTELLAAATADDGDRLLAAFTEFDRLCAAIDR